jgi:hypothetical protein
MARSGIAPRRIAGGQLYRVVNAALSVYSFLLDSRRANAAKELKTKDGGLEARVPYCKGKFVARSD